MSTTLDPENALGGPLYALAGTMVVVPIIDFLLSVATPEPTSAQWRFATVGLLSGHTLFPVLGIAIAFVVSAVLKHYTLQRVLVILCLTMAVAFIVLTWTFYSDMPFARASVPADDMPAFSSAASRALIKLLLTSIVLAYLGLRARRMIPSPVRHKAPKPVHVISK